MMIMIIYVLDVIILKTVTVTEKFNKSCDVIVDHMEGDYTHAAQSPSFL
jgi:hypothetical protein